MIDVHLDPDDMDRALRDDVRTGLTATPKTLPPKWFYDDRGSQLFDDITRLPEYYPTRCEREILDTHAGEIAEATGATMSRRARQRNVDQDPPPAGRVARRGHTRHVHAVRLQRDHAARRG